MKPDSTQPSRNDDSSTLKDELYSMYELEYISRGLEYFKKLTAFPGITGGVTGDIITNFVIRLAMNPSIMSLLLDVQPKAAFEKALFDIDNDNDVAYLNDFIDEITINVRLRNPDLFNRNNKEFKDFLIETITRRGTLNDEQMLVFNEAFSFYEPILITLHYLRKIGYNRGFRDHINNSET